MKQQDAIRATLAGREALAVAASAEVLHELAGKRVLSEPVRWGLRRLLQDVSGRVAAVSSAALGRASALAEAPPTAAAAATPVVRASSRGALARGVAAGAGGAAAREISRGALRAAGLAFLVDGAIGATRAIGNYRRRQWDGRRACLHVVKEAGSGAAASAAGVVVASAAVMLTGGLAAPVVMGIAAGGSIVAKVALTHVMGD